MDVVRALPDELTKYGTEVVDQWVKEETERKTLVTHRESGEQPRRGSDPNNGVWEDGSKNMQRVET